VIPTPTAVLAIPQLFVNFTADLPLPDIASVSIRQKMTEAFTVLATVEWTNWSRLGTIPVAIVQHGPNIGIPTTLPFEWRDGWLFSGAAEYQWTQSVAVRAGIGWERSPVTDQVRGTQLPDNDRLWVSAGLTYDWNERLSLELGYSHIVVKETPINIVPGNPLFTPSFGSFIGTANAQVDIISLALRYRWFPGAAPYVVTKAEAVI
jgi:long-chain fatty acid transport protein